MGAVVAERGGAGGGTVPAEIAPRIPRGRGAANRSSRVERVMSHAVDLSRLSTRELLRLYADILTALVERGVVRSRNAPAGDLAEYLVATAYGGELAPPSEKSWDVRADGRLLQVKARLIAAGDNRSHVYSPFRSWDFDACVFLLLDAHTYEISRAVELPVATVQALARETAWVKGFRITTKTPLLEQPGALDVTPVVRRALDALGSQPPSTSTTSALNAPRGPGSVE